MRTHAAGQTELKLKEHTLILNTYVSSLGLSGSLLEERLHAFTHAAPCQGKHAEEQTEQQRVIFVIQDALIENQQEGKKKNICRLRRFSCVMKHENNQC